MTVLINNAPIDFPNTEFNLLYFLANNQGKALTRNKIISETWWTEFISHRTIDVHVSKIRKKIGDKKQSNGSFKFIQTVKSIGYRLSEELDIEIDDDITKNKDDVRTEDDIIINGSYKDSKKNIAVVINVAESKFGKLVVFASVGTCNAMPIKDFKLVYKPL